jgi:hypothetical protein
MRWGNSTVLNFIVSKISFNLSVKKKDLDEIQYDMFRYSRRYAHLTPGKLCFAFWPNNAKARFVRKIKLAMIRKDRIMTA